MFSHVFSLYFKQTQICDVFFVCYVKSDPKIAGGILPKTLFLRSERKYAFVLNFVHVFCVLYESDA